VAGCRTHTVSQATLGSGASIVAPGGNVTVDAKGKVNSSPKAIAQIFVNGTAGISTALNFDLTDVHSQADGQITAAGRTVAATPINLSAVNADNDTITIPNHGLHTGDQVVYSSGGGSAIGGLDDGQTYYVLVIDPNTIRLTKGLGIALDNSGVTSHAQQSLSRQNALSFDPSTAVGSGGTLLLPGHPFTTGQQVTYYSLVSDPVTGLTNQGTYFVIVHGPNAIRL